MTVEREYYLAVRFINGINTTKDYYYKSYIPVVVGDWVVVEANSTFQIARVSMLLKEKNEQCKKEVVSLIDMTDYEERKTRAKRAADVKKKMDARVKKLQDMSIYIMLAEKDEELSEMLKEYRELV